MESIEVRDHRLLKSTNGRSAKGCPALARWCFAALRLGFRPTAERLAAWLFCHPLRVGLAPEDASVLSEGHAFRLRAGGYDLAARPDHGGARDGAHPP